MIIRKNKDKTKQEFLNGGLNEIQCFTPNIADKIITYAENELMLSSHINLTEKVNFHKDAIDPMIFIYSLLSAKTKCLFSISEASVALTAPELIKKYDLNILSKKDIMTEGNMRSFINKISTQNEVSDNEIEKILNSNIKKNNAINNPEKRKTVDKEEIKKEIKIKKSGSYFINLFNDIMSKLVETIDRPKIHILDCVKIPVTTNNKNYELSTIIDYEGSPMRGYKMGVLRGLTENGGVIEFLIDGTIIESDITLTENPVANFDGFKEGDFLLADRGFAKIEFIKKLVKRGINVIIPAKKNMDIFTEAVNQAKKINDCDWHKHPNSKRDGQEVVLIKDLKGVWLDEKEKNKKPVKALETATDFSACVIRIEKEKNEDIVSASEKSQDITDALLEDEKYIYIVILSTNTSLSASEIVRYYELRPEIEEDFRQLKDIWKMCTFYSTKYMMIMCNIAMTFLAYNLFNLYKYSPSGAKYINKSMRKIINEETRERYAFEELTYFILCGNNYCLLDGLELLDLYAECDKNTREKIRPLLSRK